MVFTVYGEHWRKVRRIMTVPFFTNKVVQQYRFGWEDEAGRVVEDVRKNPEAATTGIVLRRRLQLMMYNNMYRIMFDRRFESEEDPLFVKLKALNGERSRLAQSFEYNYGDFIPILRPFLRGYLKICKEVKERRLQLFKDYFVDERKKLGSTKSMDNNSLKCAIDHILDAQQKGEINEDNLLYIVENINVAGRRGERLVEPSTVMKESFIEESAEVECACLASGFTPGEGHLPYLKSIFSLSLLALASGFVPDFFSTRLPNPPTGGYATDRGNPVRIHAVLCVGLKRPFCPRVCFGDYHCALVPLFIW
ncbi:cinnamate-4-hydroxylase [Actinidia rufa]|uniref:Cinnamate-4-hydroxylase n=1 Tax=Actinidia rufa TaxID=165716 RepID=A0A7J0FSN8_9ERIC|nr:cinnamate-4-hydroxylase [Actinidia rufa]